MDPLHYLGQGFDVALSQQRDSSLNLFRLNGLNSAKKN